MQKHLLFLIILLLACTGLFAQNVSLDQAVQTSAKTIETRLPQGAKAAVLTFTSKSKDFSDYIIDEIATALSASKNIQVIDRQHTDDIRKEFNIQFSGDVSDAEVKRIGQQLGAQFVVTGSLVDIGNAYRFRVAAINIETAVREGSSSLNININDPQVVFLLTGKRPEISSTPSKSVTYKIGDKGPGGGFVFYIKDGLCKECSPSGSIGKFNYGRARELANTYQGGGFDNWRLPNMQELNLMYMNLKQKNIGGFFNETYWSSNESVSKGYVSSVTVVDFGSGNSSNYSPGEFCNVRAVREFRQ